MHLDEAIAAHVGDFGLWQKVVFLAAGFALFPANLFLPTFVGYLPEFRCLVTPCESLAPPSHPFDKDFVSSFMPTELLQAELGTERCWHYEYQGNGSTCDAVRDFNRSQLVRCHRSVYDGTVFRNSLVTEFDIGPCSDLSPGWYLGSTVSKMALMEIAFWSGVILGCTFFGWLADVAGGRKSLLLATAIVSLSSLLTAAVGNYWYYMTSSFVIGFAALGAHSVAYVQMTEVIGKPFHQFLPLIMNFRVLGSVVYGVVAYFGQSWRVVWVYAAFANLLILPVWAWLKESPRWLLNMGRYDDARVALQIGAQLNGRETMAEEVFAEVVETSERNRKKNKEADANITQFFRNPVILTHLLVMYLAWFSVMMTYFGLVRISITLAGDIFVNFFLISVAESFSSIFSYFFIARLGRKILVVLPLALSGCFMLITVNLTDPIAVIALNVAAKLGSSVALQSCYLYVAELNPTAIRNTAMGSSSTFGRLGALVSSWVINSKDIGTSTTFLIFGVIDLFAAFMVLCVLPETLDTKMPETADDVKEMKKNSMPVTLWVLGLKKKKEERQSLLPMAEGQEGRF